MHRCPNLRTEKANWAFGYLVSFVYFRYWSTQKTNFIQNYPINIHIKFGYNWPRGYREEELIHPTPFLTPLGLSFVYFRSTKNKKNLFRGPSKPHSHRVRFQLSPWLQRRRLIKDREKHAQPQHVTQGKLNRYIVNASVDTVFFFFDSVNCWTQ